VTPPPANRPAPHGPAPSPPPPARRYVDILAAAVRVAERLPPLGGPEWPALPSTAPPPPGGPPPPLGPLLDASPPWFLGHHGWPAANGGRVALLAEPGAALTSASWGAWMRGGVLVPLAPGHPRRELDHVMSDAGPAVVASDERHAEAASRLAADHGAEFVCVPEPEPAPPPGGDAPSPLPPPERAALEGFLGRALRRVAEVDAGALLIYTSGTTGRPKGALHTHAGVSAQVASLARAWGMGPGDAVAHALPMHHIHGLVNAWLCPHRVGGCVHFVPRFTAGEVWDLVGGGAVSVLMGVPTMYSLLLSDLRVAPAGSEERRWREAGAAALRLAVSGSAACPAPVMERWRDASGSYLLERYGMTEVGMALSNPLDGPRRPGHVGTPLPFVEVATASGLGLPGGPGGAAGEGARGAEGRGDGEGTPGAGGGGASGEGEELLVRGPSLFRGYWGRPEATAESLVDAGDGGGLWFRTGDTVAVRGGSYAVLGRTSVDVIKSRGYKLSALAIESAILEHPRVREAAVLGLPDPVQGQVVAAVVALTGEGGLRLTELRSALRGSLPRYALPERMETVDAIPRNAMGKVNKRQLAAWVAAERGGSTQ